MYKPLSVKASYHLYENTKIKEESPTHSCYLSVSGCIAADLNKSLNNKLFLIFY